MTTNKSVQAERRALAGSSATSTFFREATKSRTLSGGWVAEAMSATSERDLVVAGESPATLYPRLPASSPWSGAAPQVPDEGPTNIDINAQEPTGTFAEVQRSEFANSEDPASPFNRQMDGEANGVGDPAPAGATPAARATSSTAPARSSSPLARLPGDVATLDRLAELMAEGLVRPKLRRRKL